MEVIMGHDCGNSKEYGVGHYHVSLKKDSILLIIVHIVTRLYIELTTLFREPFDIMEVIMGHNRGNSNEFGVGHHHLTVKKDRIFLIIVNIVIYE